MICKKFFILFCSLFIVCGLSALPFGEKPNIILVITDDQGYGPIGKHDHPWIQTPNLDKLHSQSIRFERFLVSPTCSPTRAALMSGRHPMKNGITHTILERERMALSTVTLPQVLAKAGYSSGIFGKWHLGDEEPYQPHKRGFDEAFIHGAGGIGQKFNCSCADVPGNKYFDPVIRHNGSFVKTNGYCTDLFFTAGMGWIKDMKEKSKPFFAYISTNAPHGPFIAPPKYAKKFTDRGFSERDAGFYGMIENIDKNMGRLMEKLDQWDLNKNTILIFMSDNGSVGGMVREGSKLGTSKDGKPMEGFNAGMKGAKASADEGGVRVPFFVRWPGKFSSGKAVERISAHIDLLPTLAHIAGIDQLPKGQVEGRSLVPLLKNPKAKWKDRYLFTQGARWKTGAEPTDHMWKRFAVRNERFRLVENSLYDMKADPGQTTDVASKFPEIVKSMKEAYEKFWKDTRPLMVNENAPMSPTRPYHVLYEKQLNSEGIPTWREPNL
jgi:arylsulfatase